MGLIMLVVAWVAARTSRGDDGPEVISQLFGIAGTIIALVEAIMLTVYVYSKVLQ